jgi:3-deoxy-D-manno-octulosonic-acid transferase
MSLGRWGGHYSTTPLLHHSRGWGGLGGLFSEQDIGVKDHREPRRMIELLYRLLILPAGILGWMMALPFSAKARSGWTGRRRWRAKLSTASIHWGSRPRVWFHCSSLGEFEQAVPVLRTLRASWPEVVLIATVFSPSGYDKARGAGAADWVGYLPFDTKRNVSHLMSVLRPAALVFMRYDTWPGLVGGARRAGVPVVIAAAALNPRSPLRSRVLRSVARFLYRGSFILAVNSEEAAAFESLVGAHAHVETARDPRFDRVRQKSEESGPRGSDLFPPGSLVLIAGSTHAPDERLVAKALSPWPVPGLRLLLVPHDPTERRLRQVERVVAAADLRSQRWSTLGNGRATVPIVIVDVVGRLAHLYRGCHVAYVGGGFSSGVHNVLEPAAAGVPILLGPRHWRSPEARELIRRGGARPVGTSKDLAGIVALLFGGGGERERMADVCHEVIREGAGASGEVANRVRNVAQSQG